MPGVGRNGGLGPNPTSLWEGPLSRLGLPLFLEWLSPAWQGGLHGALQLALAPETWIPVLLQAP